MKRPKSLMIPLIVAGLLGIFGVWGLYALGSAAVPPGRGGGSSSSSSVAAGAASTTGPTSGSFLYRASKTTPGDPDTTCEEPPRRPEFLQAVRNGGKSVLSGILGVLLLLAKNSALPLTVLLLGCVFVVVQDSIDRRDPKLALAPVYADPDLQFEQPRVRPKGRRGRAVRRR